MPAIRWPRSGTSCRCSNRSTQSPIASPTQAHRAAVRRFASGAERYLNRGLHPLPGYSPYPGDREPGTETWFDDNGWWGLAFVNAYRATGSRRYLTDAQRALDYIARAGWDPRGGGIWWNTTHPYKAGAALGSDTLLATLLYQLTGSRFDLGQARRFLSWGNSSSGGFSSADGFYAGSNINPTPVDYIEGPLIYAQASLCRLTGNTPECELADRLKGTALTRFGYLLDFSPQYDAIYLQWMLALYGLENDPTLYRLAADNARDVADPGGQRPRPLPAVVERADPAQRRCAARDAPDAGGEHQPLRLAGRVPAARQPELRRPAPAVPGGRRGGR